MTNNTTDLMIQVLGRDIKPHNLNQCLLVINSKSFGRNQAFLSFFQHIFFVATSLQLLLKTIEDEMNCGFDTL